MAKCLGVLIDEELNWTEQVEKVTKTVQSKLSMLRRVKPFVPTECLTMLYNSFVQPDLIIVVGSGPTDFVCIPSKNETKQELLYPDC